jgi:hypothetical protein
MRGEAVAEHRYCRVKKKSAEPHRFMVIFILLQTKLPKTMNSTDMGMITQDMIKMQEAISEILRCIPVVFTSDSNRMYFLVKNIDPELEAFITTGKTDTGKFQVFSNADMYAMTCRWEQLGLTDTYHSQPMEYMHRNVVITYPKVSDPATGNEVLLMPWFMLPGRPFPIFTYIYGIWHYRVSGEKSQRVSAAAVAKIFGLCTFNKSTLCRNIRSMRQIFETVNAAKPLSAKERAVPSAEELCDIIPKILKDCPVTETSNESLGGICRIADELGNMTNAAQALDGIPFEYSEVLKEQATPPVRRTHHDARKWAARPRKRRNPPNRHKPEFVAPSRREEIRKAFIVICRDIIIGAAITSHQLIL